MLKTEKHTVCKLNAMSWTHLHIGSGKVIGRWEYFLENRKLYMLDYEKLSKIAIDNPDIIDQLTNAASKEPSSSLNEFLSRRPDLRRKLAGLSLAVPSSVNTSDASMAKIVELKLFIGSPSCYIPGSSLKGAIRTPFLSEKVKNKQLTIPQLHGTRYQRKNEFSRVLEKTFELKSEDSEIFRHVIVRDSAEISPNDLGIASVKLFAAQTDKVLSRSSPQRRSGAKDQDLFCQVVLCNTAIPLEIVLRNQYSNEKGVEIKNILDTCDRFYRRAWAQELQNRQSHKHPDEDLIDFYQSCLPSSDEWYLMRIGHGSGQLATSLLMDYQQKYRLSDGKPADQPLRQGPVYRDEKKLFRSPYPYTSKTAVASGVDERQPLGWLVISKDIKVEHEN